MLEIGFNEWFILNALINQGVGVGDIVLCWQASRLGRTMRCRGRLQGNHSSITGAPVGVSLFFFFFFFLR